MSNLTVTEYQNQRILTTAQLADSYEVDSQLIVNNFNRNRDRYKEGKHFFSLEGETKRLFIDQHQIDLGLKNSKTLYLWSEKGCLHHAKSLGTDKAWEVFEMLEETYFKVKEAAKDSYMIENPIERAERWIEERKEVEVLLLGNKQKDQLIGELKPRADYTDNILKNKGLVTITQISKDYGMSGQSMNEVLHELGIQYKQSEQWLLYRNYHDKGYTQSETIAITRSDGRGDVKMNTKWTTKGRLFIYNLLKNQKSILPVIEREFNKNKGEIA